MELGRGRLHKIYLGVVVFEMLCLQEDGGGGGRKGERGLSGIFLKILWGDRFDICI